MFFCLIMIRKCVTKLHNISVCVCSLKACACSQRSTFVLYRAEKITCHSDFNTIKKKKGHLTDQLSVTASVFPSRAVAVEQLFLLSEDVFFQTRARTQSRLENNCLLVTFGSHMAALSSLAVSSPLLSYLSAEFLSAAPFFSTI